MDAAPQLITTVRFDEVKRGYDPEQVDTYLEEIALSVDRLKAMAPEALERAEAAEARAAEARRALEDARAQAAEPQDDATKAAGILALAQQTAEAARQQAETEAHAILADARTKAAELVAEAETRSREQSAESEARAATMLSELTAEIEAMRAEQLQQLRDELAGLEAARDHTAGEVEQLQAVLADERERLRTSATAILAVLDGPPGLQLDAERLPQLPEPQPEVQAEPESEPELELQAAPAPEPEVQAEPEPELEAQPEPVVVVLTEDEPTQAVPVSELFADEPADDPADDPLAPLNITTLYDDGDDRDDAPIVLDDSPLGPVDDESDAAMRAFFEGELEANDGKPRWNRRKR